MLDYFLELGIRQDETDISRRAYIQYFNFDLMGYMAFAILSVPVVFLLPEEIRLMLHVLGFIYVLVIALCFYLNSMGRHIISSVIINTALLFVVAFTDISIGSESHLHFFLITVCITPLFFLRQHQWLAYMMMATSFALFLLLSEGVVDLPHSSYRSPEIIPFFRTVVNILVIPLTTLRFLYIFKINDRYLTEINGQKQYLRKIIDLNPSSIFAKNRTGQYTIVNQSVADIYGTTVENLVGKTDADFNADREEVAQFLRDDIEVMESRRPKYISQETITDVRSGRKLYMQTVKTPILEDNGAVNQVLGVSTDITERIETQHAMEQMRDALSRKNRELEKYIDSNLQLENFAYIASHDLREPLRSIIGYSQLLERRYADKLDDDGRQFLTHLVSSTKNMNMLITDLLLFSRVNTDAVKHQVLDMAEIKALVMENLRAVIIESNARVKWHDMPATITADKSRIIQLFQNLIGNGIKFHKSHQYPQVDIYYRMIEGYHEFEVRDNGIGIDAKFHEKIFHIFHRLHNRTQYEGSGIGLATCHKIVEQHSGTIRVISAPGSGSAFIFTISID
jgi:PAS domain S-box-containing protein